MRKIKLISWVLAICTVMTALSSCSLNESFQKRYSKDFFTLFDTKTTITAYDSSQKAFNEKADDLYNVLWEYHRLFDIYNEYEGMNNLCTVNKNAGKGEVAVDEKIIDLIEFGKEMYQATDGNMNIMFGAVTSVWHTYREEGVAVPEDDLLNSAAQHTDINSVITDREKGTVCITDENASIDVGAVAKGYATEKAAEFIKKRGWSNIAMSVGGNVRTIGTKTMGRKWRTGIENPGIKGDAIIKEVALENMSCVTSGTYRRFYSVNGVKYHHIINPVSLHPENTYLSVTVICKDSGIADALSTALFNMSENDGRELCKKMNIDAMWVYATSVVSSTGGFRNYVVK